ncbi:PmoA family protein [Paenarthrobacter sp. S56]|uniref:DUF6807 domain-containing protein n=1 Tax=Paenarthrobacter sp. S56 TaxID=3138179 RepID=UPI003219C67A
MRVVEAIRTAEAPTAIPSAAVDWVGSGDQEHAVIPGIEEILERATTANATFSELALPWAVRGPVGAEPLFSTSSLANAPGCTLRTGKGLDAGLSPRPYLHPITTRAGITLTDHMPVDHAWHLGAGFALQDVNGSNFWGGRSYRRSSGRYMDLEDHGRMEIRNVRRGQDHTTLDLEWMAADGSRLLTENRSFRRSIVNDRTWRLDLATGLTAVVDSSLGSPGSHGLSGSGYGGFFWRLPVNGSARVFSSTAEGETAVHGSVSPWLAWAGNFDGGPATLVFGAPEESADPWFVRLGEYPAVGSALAWIAPVELAAGESLVRSVAVWISDGILSADEVEDLVAGR